MMRLIRSLLIVSISCLFLGTVFATFSADTFIAQFQNAATNLSFPEKKAYYLKVYNNITMLAIKNRNDAEQYELYTSLKNYIKTQITALGDVPVVSTSATGMIIPKVDLAKVREVRLTLHNTERATKKLTPFTYSSVLEGTATTWANYLANSGKTRGLHKRKSTDPTYSYDSIKQWFLDQGIVFAGKEKNRQALFTENLSYGYYTCKKADCTEDFIKAIKGTGKSGRSFFMSEKPYGLHYNAIMGNYSHVGLGVAVVGNKYYLVSHYTQVLK